MIFILEFIIKWNLENETGGSRMSNKLIEAIERRCFSEISLLAFEHIFKNSLKIQMIDDYLGHGKLTDKTIEEIKAKFK